MKVIGFASIIGLTLVSLAAAEVAAPAAPVEALPGAVGKNIPSFSKRACTPSNCICNGVQGQFCGDESINPDCRNDHVYECNRDTGKACDYGYRTSCAQCGQLQC